MDGTQPHDQVEEGAARCPSRPVGGSGSPGLGGWL